MSHIVLVEDDQDIAKMVLLSLKHHGYNVTWLRNVELTQVFLQKKQTIDCFLIDWMLPGRSGKDFVLELRDRHDALRDVPILMLSARGQEHDKVNGLKAGADDYLAKPFSMRELQARIFALLRRVKLHQAIEDTVVCCGALSINTQTHQAILDLPSSSGHQSQPIAMSKLEFRMLHYLVKRQGHALSRTVLIQQVWDHQEQEERTVDVCIKRLRQVLAPYDAAPTIETVRGIGYRLTV